MAALVALLSTFTASKMMSHMHMLSQMWSNKVVQVATLLTEALTGAELPALLSIELNKPGSESETASRAPLHLSTS